VIIDGMSGHSPTRELWPDIAARITGLVHRTEAAGTAA
jgi:hypothetical protein